MEVKAISDSSQIGSRLLSEFQSRESRSQTNATAGQADGNITGQTDDTRETVEKFNEVLSSETNLRMYYDEDTNQVIVTVVDAETEEVVRQLPPEDLISFARNFDQYLGTLYDGRV